MAAEWGGANVQANSVAPGYIHTEMTQNLVDDPDFNAWVVARTPGADLVGRQRAVLRLRPGLLVAPLAESEVVDDQYRDIIGIDRERVGWRTTTR